MSLIILVLTFYLLILIMEIAAIILKSTGMEIGKARFQALSALTSVGFTTRESELIVQHPLRRRVISVLMVISYLGMATVVGSVFGSWTKKITPHQVLIAGSIFVGGFLLFSNRYLINIFERGLEKQIKKSFLHHQTFWEVLKLSDDYGVAEFILHPDVPLVGQSIAGSKIRDKGIFIMAIERGSSFIHSPRGNEVLEAGDKLIVYGKTESIKNCLLQQSIFREGE
ncbi:cation:proton antiporter regulatory subunit [Carboxydothermus ferrireducens]|uniref:RCK C-terminal domain-containing protein n=1 Tax=Carboxydothermus ferrireducens DSM 11255 TaxID=1119529 RepID=A0ABX2RAE4_9THEO|nr:TrkA C-terminal domain-containing protein [Carboxydothermus ferrireducens]NYE57043.1 hypothetical protein [Carboxydothermus ferrireducens DSM 11255]